MTPTGGSHGTPHQTTKILSRPWRGGSGVAVGGACAAARADAAHRRAAAGSPRRCGVAILARGVPAGARAIVHELLDGWIAEIGLVPADYLASTSAGIAIADPLARGGAQVELGLHVFEIESKGEDIFVSRTAAGDTDARRFSSFPLRGLLVLVRE
jgi:hypothetical protein